VYFYADSLALVKQILKLTVSNAHYAPQTTGQEKWAMLGMKDMKVSFLIVEDLLAAS
jgi:hypothetical protein